MASITDRRRFLQLAGAGAALSVAGCNALDDVTGSANDGGNDGDGRTVTLAVQPDQQQLQQRQADIQAQVQEGELNRSEAQVEFRTAQQELTTAAVESFRDRLDDSPLSVEDSVAELGVLQVAGPADALLDTLAYEEVAALLPEETFETAASGPGAGSG